MGHRELRAPLGHPGRGHEYRKPRGKSYDNTDDITFRLSCKSANLPAMPMKTPSEVIPSAEAREKLPRLIEEIAGDPDTAFSVGRHRKREIVIVSAERFDELVERAEAHRDLAWAAFAQDRIENPTSAPVSWEEAQRRRKSRG